MSKEEQLSDLEYVELLIVEGRRLLCAGDLPVAVEHFQAAVDLNPDHINALAYLTIMLEKMGRFEEMEPLLTRLTERLGDQEKMIDVLSHTIHELDTDKLGMEKREQSTEDKPLNFRAAFIEVEITPNIQSAPVVLQGYWTATPRYAQKVMSPLMLQAVMLEDEVGTRTLIVGADLFAFDPTIVTDVQQAAQLWGISSNAVFLNASHTHYAPSTLKEILPSLGSWNKKYTQYISDTIVKLLPLLRQRLEPACIEVGVAQAQIGYHRRVIDSNGSVRMNVNLDGPYDQNTPLLKITLQSGQSLLMVNHGCHPTGLGSTPVIFGAYPAVMRSMILEESTIDVVLFLQGAAGDLKVGFESESEPRWIQNKDEITVPARILASKVLEYLEQPMTLLSGQITTVNVNVTCELDPYKGTASQYIRTPKNRGYLQAMLTDWAKVMERRQHSSSHASSESKLTLNIGVLNIGECTMVSMNGEPMTQISLQIRELLGAKTFVLGYTNGLRAYIPTEEILLQGGYEGHYSHFVYLLSGPFQAGVEKALLGGVALGYQHNQTQAQERQTQDQPTQDQQRDRLISTPPTPLTQTPPPQRDRCQAFFVLSTGRSGTQTLAHLLRSATNAHVWHHPEPNLIQETQWAYWDTIDHHSCFWRARGEIVSRAWDRGLIHGETDHNMTPFAHRIAKDIPNSKFLVLVRDPREFIRSGMRRGYFVAGGPWDQGRLRPKDGTPFAKEWSRITPFEKVCWLWAETYRHIEHHIRLIGQERVMIVRFEDLVKTTDVAQKIFEFCELEGFDREEAQGVLSQKLNAQRGGVFPHPSEWSQKLHECAWRHCGALASAYGYPEIYDKGSRGVGGGVRL